MSGPRRNKDIINAVVAIIIIFSFGCVYAQDAEGDLKQQLQALQAKYEQLVQDRDNILKQAKAQNDQSNAKSELDGLRKDYEQVVRDRDNILAQTKNLLQYKVQMREMEDEIKRLENKNKRTEGVKQDLVERIAEREAHIEDLQKDKGKLNDDIENLKNYIEKKEIEYKIVDETKKKISQVQKEKERLRKNVLELEVEIEKIEAERLAAEADAELYRRQFSELRNEYKEALSANKGLERELTDVPKKFAQIARENKILTKETALMHYNLGVFYTEEGQHKRAVAEFEKSVELNPEDAYAYFNLGYIYAEHLVNRTRAIEFFKEYLRLADGRDKDDDWVKKYILTWQAWEGKTTAK